jgi:hypothetical protein
VPAGCRGAAGGGAKFWTFEAANSVPSGHEERGSAGDRVGRRRRLQGRVLSHVLKEDMDHGFSKIHTVPWKTDLKYWICGNHSLRRARSTERLRRGAIAGTGKVALFSFQRLWSSIYGGGSLSASQIAAVRAAISRHLKRQRKLWVRVFPSNAGDAEAC